MDRAIKTILVILAIGFAIFYYTHSDSYINSKPIGESDIVGTWDYSSDVGLLKFKENGSIKSNIGYFHGSWKIISSEEKLVQVSFDMSDEEYATALQELYIDSMTDEELYENGYEPYEYMKEDVWELYSLPEDDVVFRYIRSEDKMIAIEYDDWEIYKEK